MTTSITSLLQALHIIPTSSVKQKTSQSITTTTNKSNVSSPVTSLPEICLETVAQHDDYSDCWIVIYDRVYDVTNFLQDHPGGADIIMDYAGRDATLAFHGTGHSRDAIEQMRDYLIGELPSKERIFRTKNTQVLLKGIPE
uniref:Cytochrome b5 heme-binding domain-containing protein n=1 Tax=Glossina brevipalpis TaxID=37001 RepID=A0A1A9WLM5_9MUSC